jgi:hypothetical protein
MVSEKEFIVDLIGFARSGLKKSVSTIKVSEPL